MKKRSLILGVALVLASMSLMAMEGVETEQAKRCRVSYIINATAVVAPLALTYFSYTNSFGGRLAWGALQCLVNACSSYALIGCGAREGLEDEDSVRTLSLIASFCLPHVASFGLNTLRDVRNSNFSNNQKVSLGVWNLLCGVGGFSGGLFLKKAGDLWEEMRESED